MSVTRIRWINALFHRGPGYDLPSQAEADLRAALTDLAERWERMAAKETASVDDDFFIDDTPLVEWTVTRARAYRTAASDLREVLRTGHAPHDLMTDAELEQYGTPEATS